MQETQVQSLGQEDPPREGDGNPLQYSCLGKPMDRGAWQAVVYGVTKSQTWLSEHALLPVWNCHCDDPSCSLWPKLLGCLHWLLSSAFLLFLWCLSYPSISLCSPPCHHFSLFIPWLPLVNLFCLVNEEWVCFRGTQRERGWAGLWNPLGRHHLSAKLDTYSVSLVSRAESEASPACVATSCTAPVMGRTCTSSFFCQCQLLSP